MPTAARHRPAWLDSPTDVDAVIAILRDHADATEAANNALGPSRTTQAAIRQARHYADELFELSTKETFVQPDAAVDLPSYQPAVPHIPWTGKNPLVTDEEQAR